MPTKKAPTKKVAKKAVKKSTVKKAAPKKVTTKKAAPKKTAAKKTAAKKATKKTSAIKKPVKDLVYASDQESFWTTDGEILNSLIALSDAFASMDKGVYRFHAAGDQNDFAIWVETVLCDSECAQSLVKAKTHKAARTIVDKHLKNYSR